MRKKFDALLELAIRQARAILEHQRHMWEEHGDISENTRPNLEDVLQPIEAATGVNMQYLLEAVGRQEAEERRAAELAELVRVLPAWLTRHLSGSAQVELYEDGVLITLPYALASALQSQIREWRRERGPAQTVGRLRYVRAVRERGEGAYYVKLEEAQG